MASQSILRSNRIAVSYYPFFVHFARLLHLKRLLTLWSIPTTETEPIGGWNNIRMSLETIFIIALALDRTLVLPPPMPLYLLNKDKADKHREFGNFYPLKSTQWREKLNIITTEEFLEREGGEDGRFPIPAENRAAVLNAAKGCVHMKKAENFCGHLDHYLQTVGTVPVYHAQPYDPDKKKREGCFVWDEKAYQNGGSSAADKDVQEQAEKFCTEERHPFYFTKELNANPIIHFKASEKGYRCVAVGFSLAPTPCHRLGFF